MNENTWPAPWEATDRMAVAGLEHGGWGAAESYADMRDAYLAEHPERADEVLRLRAQCELLAKSVSELSAAMIAYSMEEDEPAPFRHREMMARARLALAQYAQEQKP